MNAPARRCLLLLVAILAATGSAAAQSGPGSPDDVSAFILTISGRPLGALSVPVAEIRDEASKEIASALLEWGPIVPQPKMLQIMSQWRVRDGRSIPRAFLDTLAAGFGVRRVLVVNLVVHPDRVTIAARYIDAATAQLQDVFVFEEFVAPDRSHDAAVWIAHVREMSRIAGDVPPHAPVAGARPLLLLDAQPVGCSDEDALIAGHTLLEDYVGRGGRVLIDPAVARATLHEAGFSERYIGADARTLLRNSFECSALMLPQLISYAPARRTPDHIRAFDDTAPRGTPLLSDFAMSLRLVDLDTGSIRAGREAFLPVPPASGWFGVPIDDSLLDRMKMAADRLWTDMNHALEAN